MLRFFSKIRKALLEYLRSPPGEPCRWHYLLPIKPCSQGCSVQQSPVYSNSTFI